MADVSGAGRAPAPAVPPPTRPVSAAQPAAAPEGVVAAEGIVFDDPAPRINLELNSNFFLENPGAGNRADFGPADARFEQLEARYADRPMSRSEFVDGVRDSVEEAIGENATRGVIAVGGLAHLATGGEIEFSRDTNDFMPNSGFEFEVGKDGGRASWSVRW